MFITVYQMYQHFFKYNYILSSQKKKKSKLYLFILKKKTTFIGCDLVKD